MKNERENFKHNYVMLIDDVELDNFINERLIKTYGIAKNVYLATSATSALECLNNLATASNEFPGIYPAVIFIDINMPIIDGFQFIVSFYKAFDKHLKKPKLVILTSSLFEKDKKETAFLSEEILFLNKPLSKEMLDDL